VSLSPLAMSRYERFYDANGRWRDERPAVMTSYELDNLLTACEACGIGLNDVRLRGDVEGEQGQLLTGLRNMDGAYAAEAISLSRYDHVEPRRPVDLCDVVAKRLPPPSSYRILSAEGQRRWLEAPFAWEGSATARPASQASASPSAQQRAPRDAEPVTEATLMKWRLQGKLT
jgi:hypothetical protein